MLRALDLLQLESAAELIQEGAFLFAHQGSTETEKSPFTGGVGNLFGDSVNHPAIRVRLLRAGLRLKASDCGLSLVQGAPLKILGCRLGLHAAKGLFE